MHSMLQSDLSFQGKRYYKRYIKLLALYTDLELCASMLGNEYDINIAERLVLNYQTYLDVSILSFFDFSMLTLAKSFLIVPKTNRIQTIQWHWTYCSIQTDCSVDIVAYWLWCFSKSHLL